MTVCKLQSEAGSCFGNSATFTSVRQVDIGSCFTFRTFSFIHQLDSIFLSFSIPRGWRTWINSCERAPRLIQASRLASGGCGLWGFWLRLLAPQNEKKKKKKKRRIFRMKRVDVPPDRSKCHGDWRCFIIFRQTKKTPQKWVLEAGMCRSKPTTMGIMGEISWDWNIPIG